MARFEVEIYMDGYVQVEQRTRYSFWNLLGDVGGFHDGLFLLVSIFYAPFASLAFSLDFAKGTTVDSGKNGSAFENSERF